MRKHIEQMSAGEIDFVQWLLTSIRESKEFIADIDISYHCIMRNLSKKVEHQITIDEMQQCYLLGDFFEVNTNNNSFRVALRHNVSLTKSVIIILDLYESTVITAYGNHAQDNHQSIDWSQYNWSTDIRRYLLNGNCCL